MLLTTLIFSLFTGGVTIERHHVVTAQGYIESNMNRKAVGKAGEKGAFQVKECEWGKVPKDLKGQALQNERILNELLKESSNDLYTAIRKYNGRGWRAARYASKVRRMAFESALLTT